MKAIAVLICVISFILIVSVTFRTCTGFVSFFDGEKQTKMVELTDDYYYNKLDGFLWVKEKKTDSYRRVLDNRIDSLAWDKTNIVGYGGQTYFAINLLSGKLMYHNDLSNVILSDDKREKYKKLDGIPVPAIIRPD
jgi:hypothetical protein